MLVGWHWILGEYPYDAKNAMNKTLGLLLIEPQTEVFILDMLSIPYSNAGEKRLCSGASSVPVCSIVGTLPQSWCFECENHLQGIGDTCIYIPRKYDTSKLWRHVTAP